MQCTKEILQPICSAPKIQHTIDASLHIYSLPKMMRTRDAAYLRFTIPKIHHIIHQRCIAPDMHPTKEIIYQRCTIDAAHQNYNAPKMHTAKDTLHQWCNAIKIHHTKDALHQRFCYHHMWIPKLKTHFLCSQSCTDSTWTAPKAHSWSKMAQNPFLWGINDFFTIMCWYPWDTFFFRCDSISLQLVLSVSEWVSESVSDW